jgi:integrase
MRGRTIKPAAGLLVRGSKPTALIDLVLASLPSPNTRRAYRHAIEDLFTFSAGRPVTLALLLEWRAALATRISSATVNLQLSAVRRLVREARRTGVIDGQEASELLEVKGLPQRGTRSGNWLTREQTRQILALPNRKILRGKRNYCVLALFIGCALRRNELAVLEVDTLQRRDNRWVLADIIGKGGRTRTVAVPGWVMVAIDQWRAAALAVGKPIAEGRLIRRLTLSPDGLSEYAIWEIVSQAAARIGVAHLGPHDLRRTCAKLCRTKGGDIEQIQFMLGHESIRTTQLYLGTLQNLETAVNDNLGL